MTTYETAINTIITILAGHVPFTVHNVYGGLQLRFPWCTGDVACHPGTYGADLGHVESYQFPWDDGDVTELEPEKMALRIVNYYEEVKNNDK